MKTSEEVESSFGTERLVPRMSTSDQHETSSHLGNATPERLEQHTPRSSLMRDAIIGLADGLTVPFAVTAGLSSTGSTTLVILAGAAEVFAGSVSMGLGAYLATLTDAQHFQAEEAREYRQITDAPSLEAEILLSMFTKYGLRREDILPLLDSFRLNPESWTKFMMDYEVRLDRPASSQPLRSALTMGLAYFVGGLVPMIPYFTAQHLSTALGVSIGITAIMLLIFGYVKSVAAGMTGYSALRGSLETFLIGAVAAGGSYGITWGVNKHFSV